MKNQDILQDIKRYSGLGKLSIFVGAGVSRLSGFPSWGGLVQDMADEIGYLYTVDDNGNVRFSSEELLKIPQMYCDSKGESVYRDKVKSGFKNNCAPNEIHDLILSLYPNNLLTTNYDTLLEEAAIKFGRNFSVLSSDQVVSKSETSNYIVKVHGDFSGNFVLKEQDYLNYENDYILIDNVVKTIFATNLVVFVGYGLNDYNIKLILNWVKRVQSDSFVMPIFIHTGEKLSDIELLYQKGRGLRVIDCNDYTIDQDYIEKYRTVLKNILMHNNKHDLVDRTDKLHYFHDKIVGIKNLDYIRREDFNNIFFGEYELNDKWIIVNKTTNYEVNFDENNDIKTISSIRLDFFEDFIENEEEYKAINYELYTTVKRFVEKCAIKGIGNINHFSIHNVNIKSPAFSSQYEIMYDFCRNEYTSLKDNYEKAYYLAHLGEYELSYNLYTDILKNAKDAEQWDIYFFSQINRHYLFSVIRQLKNHTTGFQGTINFGKELELFYEEFLEKLNYEMQYMRLETQFLELPLEFRSQYSFLKEFARRNCYIDKYYGLTKEKYELEKSLQKDTIYFGVSRFDKIKLTMLETTKFIYDNMILFAGFDENKLYIKNAMIAWIEAYHKEISKSRTGTFSMISNSRYKITLMDIILISKNFKKDDVDYLINKVDLRNVPFDETLELENYIKKHIETYNSMFNQTLTGAEIFVWKFYSEEIKMLLSIAPYFVTDNKCKLDAVRFIINMPDGHFDISDRIRIIDKWIGIAKVEGISLIIENWLLEKIIPILENQIPPIRIDCAISDVSMIAQLLSDIIEADKCSVDAISELIIDNRDNLVCVKPCLEYVYQVLNDEAKQIADSVCEIKDVFQLMRKYYSGNLPKDFNEFSVVEAYLNEKIREKQENEKKGIGKYSFPSEEEYIAKVAAYMFIRNFPPDITEKYCGIYSAYDFLLCPLKFKRDTFQLEWLFTYSDNLYEKLKQCKIQKQVIIECIEKAFDENQLNQWQTRSLFEIYRMMRD